MNAETPGKERFAALYDDKPPWDIGKPQTAFEVAADRIKGDVLDAGCGTGENALMLAAKGHRVTGVDFLEQPLEIARRKARERGLPVDFLEMDALSLGTLPRVFDSVIDCGLFHTFSDEDRPRYAQALGEVLRPGGHVFILSFSDEEPPGEGPRRVTQQEIRDTFSQGWEVISIEAARFDVRPDVDLGFSPGGPKAWFSVMRRGE